MVELHTGEALFAGTNEEDQMMKIVEVMGMPPRHMLDQSKVANRFFKRNESDQWVPREHRHRYLKPGTRTLSEVLSKPFARRHGERGHRNRVFNLGPVALNLADPLDHENLKKVMLIIENLLIC